MQPQRRRDAEQDAEKILPPMDTDKRVFVLNSSVFIGAPSVAVSNFFLFSLRLPLRLGVSAVAFKLFFSAERG
jgi:hypothetical protein